MSDDRVFLAFLGERKERFLINSKLIDELEHVTDTGIGTLMKRMTDGTFRHSDIIQTIRLGLIGGGASPKNAARMVETYVIDFPIMQNFPIALTILERLWFGAPVMKAIADEVKKAADDAS